LNLRFEKHPLIVAQTSSIVRKLKKESIISLVVILTTTPSFVKSGATKSVWPVQINLR